MFTDTANYGSLFQYWGCGNIQHMQERKTQHSVNILALNQPTVNYSCSCDPSVTENMKIIGRHFVNYIFAIARFS